VDKKYSVCLLNTDEIILACKQKPEIPKLFDVKTNIITQETFKKKKTMFESKRKLLDNSSTRPFILNNGMLL
jgi:hypothetical protein